jgi:hypothetical protein
MSSVNQLISVSGSLWTSQCKFISCCWRWWNSRHVHTKITERLFSARCGVNLRWLYLDAAIIVSRCSSGRYRSCHVQSVSSPGLQHLKSYNHVAVELDHIPHAMRTKCFFDRTCVRSNFGRIHIRANNSKRARCVAIVGGKSPGSFATVNVQMHRNWIGDIYLFLFLKLNHLFSDTSQKLVQRCSP